MTNIRLWNNRAENGGESTIDCTKPEKLDYWKKLLAEYQQEEPNSGWRLETRGTQTTWHPFGTVK
jgi:hypothetical protein